MTMTFLMKKAQIGARLACAALSAQACLLTAGCVETGGTDEAADSAVSTADLDTDSSSDSVGEDPFYSEPGRLPQSSNPCREPVLVQGVLKVIDGDTFWADMESGPREKVRLLGVDTPEVSHDGAKAECFAERSTEYTRSKLTSDRFWMSFDDECQDHYGRTLAYITTREGFFQRAQLEGGFAVVMTVRPNDTFEDEFERAQQSAIAADAGLWGECRK